MNLHPIMVHFPIALLVVAVVFDLAALVMKRPQWSTMALSLQAMGAVGAVAALLTGEKDEHAAERIAGIDAILDRHEDLGKLAMWVALAVVAIRLVMLWRGWHSRVAGQAFGAALGLVAAALIGATGYWGGKLVYDYGAGVVPVMQQLPAETENPRSNESHEAQ